MLKSKKKIDVEVKKCYKITNFIAEKDKESEEELCEYLQVQKGCQKDYFIEEGT